MPTLTLTPRERAVLERLARSTHDAAQLRRVAALLAVADGQPATAVAFRHTDWTTELLIEQLRRDVIAASDSTVRRAVHEAGYRWKRPRFILSRWSPTWRQAKGGSSGGSRAAGGRWSSSPTPRS